jgi:hypothetical protein
MRARAIGGGGHPPYVSRGRARFSDVDRDRSALQFVNGTARNLLRSPELPPGRRRSNIAPACDREEEAWPISRGALRERV